jgi:multidrug efflux pump subunit AcrB
VRKSSSLLFIKTSSSLATSQPEIISVSVSQNVAGNFQLTLQEIDQTMETGLHKNGVVTTAYQSARSAVRVLLINT